VHTRPPFRIGLAIGLVAGCTLALQVLLTRLFSAVLFYHFGFLAISLALVGVGGGALAIYARPAWFDSRPLETMLSRFAALFAVLLVIVPALLVRLNYQFTGVVNIHFALNLAVACLLATLPFLAAGTTIALAIRGYTRHVGKIYAFDLAGAGVGAVAVVPVLWLADAPTLVVALGVVAGVAALLLAGSARTERRIAGLVTGAALLLVIVSASTSLYYLQPQSSVPGRQPVADHWTPLSRVLGYLAPKDSPNALVFYDRVYAPVPIRRANEPIPGWKQLRTGPQSIGYAVSGGKDALVIGGGGGRDIYNALSSGQRSVDVIELNRRIRDTVENELRVESGGPYSRPGVQVTIGDGRSTLASRSKKYDQIHIGFTDTLSANSATAFALTEANLYTVEAFQEYLDHLKPNGVLNVSRLYRLVGDEALRATILMLAALEANGIKDPQRNVVVILGHDIFNELYGTVLAKNVPWTASELTKIRALAKVRGNGVAYAPGGPYRAEWAALAKDPGGWQSFCANFRFNVCPPTDDNPFFFNMRRINQIGATQPPGYIYSVDPFTVLFLTLGVLMVLSAAAFVLPLLMIRTKGRPNLGSLVFFAAIGLGFLVLEIALIQRFVLFLGFPTYALSIVLFALLVFTGLGSLISTRIGDPRRTLLITLGISIALIVLAAFGLQPLLRATIAAPFVLRIILTVVLLAPFGLSLGMAMPIGLGRLSTLYPAGVPWAWAVNGIASVLASVLAIAVALVSGFTVTFLLAACFYLVALACAALWRWPERVA